MMDRLTSIFESSNYWLPDDSAEALILAMLLAFVLGQAVSWAYSRTHTTLSYSRGFAQSLVTLTLIVSLVMFVIGNSIVTAFGLIGALAIIRFRNVLKDTRDTAFVFVTLVLGMAIGSQRFTIAVLGALGFMAVTFYLHFTDFGSLGRFDGHISVRVSDITHEPELKALLNRFCRNAKPISRHHSTVEDLTELMYQVRFRDRSRSQELVDALRALVVVSDVTLVMRDEIVEA